MLLKHIKRVKAKGRFYYYFDAGKGAGGKQLWTRLPDLKDPSFGATYAACLGHRTRTANKAGAVTVVQLIDLYQRSRPFNDLKPSSQRVYLIYLRRLEKLLPTAPAAAIERRDMRLLFDKMALTPGAANLFLSTAEAMFEWAKQAEYVTTNPCSGIARFKLGEHQPWPADVLTAALEAEDDRVRLLTHMLYYTAQRIGDVLAMTWRTIDGDRIDLTQTKTGKVLSMPIHRHLAAELAKAPRRGLTIITNAAGQPMTADYARDLLKSFSAACGAERKPHGLRKNAVNALLEAGCTIAETAAISGQSMTMVEHYAKQRDQAGLATSAVLRWEANESRTFKQRKTGS